MMKITYDTLFWDGEFTRLSGTFKHYDFDSHVLTIVDTNDGEKERTIQLNYDPNDYRHEIWIDNKSISISSYHDFLMLETELLSYNK